MVVILNDEKAKKFVMDAVKYYIKYNSLLTDCFDIEYETESEDTRFTLSYTDKDDYLVMIDVDVQGGKT